MVRPSATKGHERLLGIPLLIDIDAVGLERIGRHDEVAATMRPARLCDRS
jgi:hypothetical protein